MNTRYSLIQLLVCTTLLISNSTPSSSAQEDCLQQARMGVLPGAWETIKNYFTSLDVTNQATRNRSRLLQLRAEIISLESWKQRLIEIVDAHIRGSSAGMGVSEDLRLSKIPDALAQIEAITRELTWLAKEGNLFAAEDAFKELMINLNAKRVDTLCRIAQEAASTAPNTLLMTALVKDLKNELTAISAAEEALGRYIRESNK
ncbi:hypothetical protein GGD65_003204 [Bradyrhizobium sp. CIR18]|uniref:hypothetical protein n=1 Tax=Bradyrhizobium sp. CIR18 TaxID=2663839 RepID=UPI0016068CD0|nr:hypothetical protein [Bradyrhizobium sp. CIR18]MBB4362179.1 hypothetical protein [Bradyrhizobium sp. CIR18]